MTTQRAALRPSAEPRAAGPVPLRQKVLLAPIIESEIVIVDDEGHEEPYDPAKH
ncbi:hypothetical protein [Kitasatospora sp. SC0581]|uniref:hypothetical protein n=1 Tax=Kitasatospora sp. SC0581 TaxID=3394360 RepID=UPI003A842681